MDPTLVTVGTGYIGSHICKVLVQEGLLPVVYDNLSLGHLWAVKWRFLMQRDIRDSEALETLYQAYNFIEVIHLAALSNARESKMRTLKYYQNSVEGTLSMLEVVSKYETPHFVSSSTCAVYGVPAKLLISESHEKNPINVYGETKLAIEKNLEKLPLRVAILRYFNAAVADPYRDLGESHKPETHLILRLILTALKKQDNLPLYRKNYNTPDGKLICDYIHVSDLADVHVHALKTLIKDKQSFTLNLGIDSAHSVQEVIQTLKTQFEYKLPIRLGNKEDLPVLFAKNERAHKILNWKPQFSDLPTILETIWNWYIR